MARWIPGWCGSMRKRDGDPLKYPRILSCIPLGSSQDRQKSTLSERANQNASRRQAASGAMLKVETMKKIALFSHWNVTKLPTLAEPVPISTPTLPNQKVVFRQFRGSHPTD